MAVVKADGEEFNSAAQVFVPEEAGVSVGDVLYHAALTETVDVANPFKNKGARKVRHVDVTPNIRNTASVVTAYL
jgi:hypothetical protein